MAPSPAPTRSDAPVAQPLAAAAAVALGQALQIKSGHVEPRAILLLTVALACAALAVANLPLRLTARAASRATLAILGAGLALQLAELALAPPGIHLTDAARADLAPLRAACAAAFVLCAAALVLPPSRRARIAACALLPALLLTHFLLGVWLIHASPDPHIDVYVIHRDSLTALLHGTNPFTVRSPLIYPTTQMYGPGQVAGDHLAFGYCYPPLTLLLALPGHLAGDYRYAQLAAMTLTGALVGAARPGRTATLAAAALLFTPRVLYVVEQGWTDPFVLLALASLVFAARRAPRLVPLALGLFLASKQYAPFALPLVVLLYPRARAADFARAVLIAVAVAAAVTLPMALWDARAFLWSVLVLQFHSPFRPDALSYPAFIAALGGPRLPSLVGFLALGPALYLALRRAARTPAGFAVSASLLYLVFFAFNKQAFCNYYFFVIGGLCLAVAVAGVGGADDSTSG